MKKNLRKIAAVLAMVTAVSSMSFNAFAADNVLYGDIDGDDMLTANDAALLLSYYLAPESDKVAEVFSDEEVLERALVTKELISASDGTAEGNAASIQSYGAEGAAAIISKVLGASFDEVVPKTQYAVISVDQYVATVKASHSSTVLEALDTLMSASANYTALNKEAAVLYSALSNYTLDGLVLSSDEGWAALGELIAKDQTAFMALKPAADNSQEYFTSFAENAEKAFPTGTDTTEIRAAIAAKEPQQGNISVVVGDTTVAEGSEEVLCWVVDNLLYGGKTVSTLTNSAADKVTIKTLSNTMTISATKS